MENLPAGTEVSKLIINDGEAGEIYTFSLVENIADNASFAINEGAVQSTSAFNFEERSEYTIVIRATNSRGETFDRSQNILVTDVNEAPTAVVLTPSSLNLAENTSTTSSIVVATIAVTDDALGTNALTLTGTDADRFEVSGNQLRIRPGVTLDYETKNTYSVTVNVDDSTVGVSPDAMTNLTLNLTDVNEPPSAVSLTPASVSLPENSNTTSAINLATINITDDALGTFAMTLSGADAASFVIFANQLRLRSGVNLDYETKSTYSVRLNVDDVTVGTTPDAFVDFTLTLTDVNEAPTMVVVDPNPATLSENASTVSPIVVGTLTIGDDLIGTNLLSLSGADADRFQIVGSQLRLNAGVTLDFETKPTYTVTVNVDDVTVGSTPDASTIFVLNLIDIDEVLPTVVSVSPSLNSGILPTSQTSITISYSEPMQGGSAASNFELRRHGADGILGNSDDSFSALSATYSGLSTTLTFPALIEGVYRLTAKSTLTDVAGNALDGDANGVAGGDWVRDFVVNKLDLVDASSTITPSALVGTSALDQAHAVASKPMEDRHSGHQQ